MTKIEQNTVIWPFILILWPHKFFRIRSSYLLIRPRSHLPNRPATLLFLQVYTCTETLLLTVISILHRVAFLQKCIGGITTEVTRSLQGATEVKFPQNEWED